MKETEHENRRLPNQYFTVRIQKRLTKAQVSQLWDLFDRRTHCGPDESILTFYSNDQFVGAALIRYDAFNVNKGKFPGKQPAFSIYIDLFEVAKDWRGMGVGRKMYELLESDLNLYHVELCHRCFETDNKASYHFWRKMGFHKPEAVYDMMVKNPKYPKMDGWASLRG